MSTTAGKTGTCPLFVILILLSVLLVPGCTSATGPSSASHQPAGTDPATPIPSSVDRVEVIHFHGNQQCDSCIAVGDLAEATINANFKDELASKRLVFSHINAELPENTAIAEKYGVTGSSLWIGVYDTNGFHKKEDTRVWSLTGNKAGYSSYLSAIITKRLNGDLS